MLMRTRALSAFLAAVILISLCPRGLAMEAVLPKGLKEIGDEAFSGDTSLSSLTIPEGVERIGSRAFAGTSLKEIVFPSSVTEIADDAFEGITSPSVTAPEGSYAWMWCADRNWIDPGLAIYQPYLENGRLDLPAGDGAGSEYPMKIYAPGEWKLSFEVLAPTTLEWVTADKTEGSGADEVTLQVKNAPPPKNYRVAETYVSRMTLKCGQRSLSVYVTLSKAGKFINRHINTGDHAEDIAAVALSQVGYHGGTGPNDLDGDPVTYVDKNYNKYCIYLGYTNTAWCAAFVSWCAWQAGARGIMPGSVVASPGRMMGNNIGSCRIYYFNELNSTQLKNNAYLGTVGVYTSREKCLPVRGDIIYFRWADAAASTTFSHCGVVISRVGDEITYVDGNRGITDAVLLHTIDRRDPDIAAYFTPW